MDERPSGLDLLALVAVLFAAAVAGIWFWLLFLR
jgi:hypothetical protein